MSLIKVTRGLEAVQLEVDLLAGQPAQGLGEDQGSDDVAVAHLGVRSYSDSISCT